MLLPRALLYRYLSSQPATNEINNCYTTIPHNLDLELAVLVPILYPKEEEYNHHRLIIIRKTETLPLPDHSNRSDK